MWGSVTICAKAAAIAASKAFPPSARISAPISAARGCGHTTTPRMADILAHPGEAGARAAFVSSSVVARISRRVPRARRGPPGPCGRALRRRRASGGGRSSERLPRDARQSRGRRAQDERRRGTGAADDVERPFPRDARPRLCGCPPQNCRRVTPRCFAPSRSGCSERRRDRARHHPDRVVDARPRQRGSRAALARPGLVGRGADRRGGACVEGPQSEACPAAAAGYASPKRERARERLSRLG